MLNPHINHTVCLVFADEALAALAAWANHAYAIKDQ